jgi:hypothetical protein
LQTNTSKAPEALEVGSEVALYGYSLGHAKQGGLDHLRIAAGTAAVTQFVAGFVLVDATAVAASGLSGGPLLNQSGEIVGIMSHDYNDGYLKGKHLTGTTNLSWFRRLSESLEVGHGMPTEEDMLPTAYAVRLHGKHECGVWEQIILQIETQSEALDNIVEAYRNAQIESKRAELQTIEHELRVLQMDGGFAVEEQINNATVESPGKLGMFARIRDKLRALKFEASRDSAPPLAPPLTDVEGSRAQYTGAGAGAGTSACMCMYVQVQASRSWNGHHTLAPSPQMLISYTIHHTPYAPSPQRLISYTIHHTPYAPSSQRLISYTLHHTPSAPYLQVLISYTIHHTPYTPFPQRLISFTIHHTPYAPSPQVIISYTIHHTPYAKRCPLSTGDYLIHHTPYTVRHMLPPLHR